MAFTAAAGGGIVGILSRFKGRFAGCESAAGAGWIGAFARMGGWVLMAMASVISSWVAREAFSWQPTINCLFSSVSSASWLVTLRNFICKNSMPKSANHFWKMIRARLTSGGVTI